MNKNQHKVLNYMDDKNIGCLHLDSIKKWVFKCDIRDDENLAEIAISEKFEIRTA